MIDFENVKKHYFLTDDDDNITGVYVKHKDYESLLFAYKSLLSEYRQVYNGTKLMDKNL